MNKKAIQQAKVTGNLYRIPVYERFISISSGSIIRILHIDEVGVVIQCAKEQTLTTDLIRSHLVGRRETVVYVEADTPIDAIKNFYETHEGTRIGGESPESKAHWINTDRPIQQLPPCSNLHRNQRGEFTCGVPIYLDESEFNFADDATNQNGRCGMCVLEGYDEPEGNCPVNSFFEWETEHFETIGDRQTDARIHIIKSPNMPDPNCTCDCGCGGNK